MGTAAGSLSPTHRPPVVTQSACLLGFLITDQGQNLDEASMGVEIRGRQLEARGRRRVTDEGSMASWYRCRCP